jgi:hypothetical protein
MSEKVFYIKLPREKRYVSRFYKAKDKTPKVGLTDEHDKSKFWKSEKGAKNALYKYIFESGDNRQFEIDTKKKDMVVIPSETKIVIPPPLSREKKKRGFFWRILEEIKYYL